MRTWSLCLFPQLFRLALSGLHVFAAAASAAFKSRATLQLENLALRHQLGVLRRSVKRPKLTSADRLLWSWLCEVWSDWRSVLVIVNAPLRSGARAPCNPESHGRGSGGFLGVSIAPSGLEGGRIKIEDSPG